MIRFFALILSIIVLFTPAQQLPPTVLYVAPYGAEEAAGTPEEPMSLASVLCDGCVPSGSIIWLMPGIYQGAWRSDVSGVTFRSVPGTRAILDGELEIWGSDTTWDGLEIRDSSWLTRTSQYAGSPVIDLPQSTHELNIFGARTRILRCYIHDLEIGIGAWTPARDTEIAYNLIWNNGHRGPDRGHGPAIYSQNNQGGKHIHDNVFLPGYSNFTFELYGSSAAFVRNFRLERNIHIGGRYLVGGGSPTDMITATDNLLWNTTMQLGYTAPLNGRAIATGNYIGLGKLQAAHWQDFIAAGNTIVNPAAVVTLIPPITATLTTNSYFAPPSAWRPFELDGVASYKWPDWTTQGYDAGSTFSTALPTQNKIFVYPWSAHHGVVTIYNWVGSNTVGVDLSALSLTPGASYRLVNAQNIAETLPFTAGTPVSLPAALWTVATPYKGTAPLMPFDHRFLVFLVEPA